MGTSYVARLGSAASAPWARSDNLSRAHTLVHCGPDGDESVATGPVHDAEPDDDTPPIAELGSRTWRRDSSRARAARVRLLRT
jgi:hypothetical protein